MIEPIKHRVLVYLKFLFSVYTSDDSIFHTCMHTEWLDMKIEQSEKRWSQIKYR